MADFSDLSDADIDKLVALGEIPSKQDALNLQMRSAMALRNQPINALTQGNRVSTASPWQALGQVVQGAGAQSRMNQIGQQQNALLQQQSDARKAYFNMLRGGSAPVNPMDPQLAAPMMPGQS